MTQSCAARSQSPSFAPPIRNWLSDSSQLLVIDDDPMDRAIYRRILRHDLHHTQVYECITAHAALERCQWQPPDCILLDYQLPDATGIDFVHRLSRQFGFDAFPIVMVTGFATPELKEEAEEAGVHIFLDKSALTASSLFAAVDKSQKRQSDRCDAWRSQPPANAGQDNEVGSLSWRLHERNSSAPFDPSPWIHPDIPRQNDSHALDELLNDTWGKLLVPSAWKRG